jgi:hypothetical protein
LGPVSIAIEPESLLALEQKISSFFLDSANSPEVLDSKKYAKEREVEFPQPATSRSHPRDEVCVMHIGFRSSSVDLNFFVTNSILTKIKLSSCAFGVHNYLLSMKISASVRGLEIRDCSPGGEMHPLFLESYSDKVVPLIFQFDTFHKLESDYPGIASKFSATFDSVRCNFLNRFLGELLTYFLTGSMARLLRLTTNEVTAPFDPESLLVLDIDMRDIQVNIPAASWSHQILSASIKRARVTSSVEHCSASENEDSGNRECFERKHISIEGPLELRSALTGETELPLGCIQSVCIYFDTRKFGQEAIILVPRITLLLSATQYQFLVKLPLMNFSEPQRIVGVVARTSLLRCMIRIREAQINFFEDALQLRPVAAVDMQQTSVLAELHASGLMTVELIVNTLVTTDTSSIGSKYDGTSVAQSNRQLLAFERKSDASPDFKLAVASPPNAAMSVDISLEPACMKVSPVVFGPLLGLLPLVWAEGEQQKILSMLPSPQETQAIQVRLKAPRVSIQVIASKTSVIRFKDS